MEQKPIKVTRRKTSGGFVYTVDGLCVLEICRIAEVLKSNKATYEAGDAIKRQVQQWITQRA